MDRKYACYCGLHCENCAVKVKVESAAKVLYAEMYKLGFEEIVSYYPDGDKFWSFLKRMSNEGICTSCRDGSGDPGCKIRPCAKAKNVEMCAFCESYPCEHFAYLFKGYHALEHDNAVLRNKGWNAWEKLQEERHAENVGIAYDRGSSEL